MTSGSFGKYYRDKVNDDGNENDNAGNYKINSNKATTSKSFEYNTIITGSTSVDDNILDTEVFVTLKHLSKFGVIS